MRHLALVVTVFAFGCSGDDGSPPPVDGPAVDSPSSNACTGALYDPCTDNSQCMSGNCRMFNNLGIMLCTQDCTNMACPNQGSTAVMCSTGNNRVCRPTMANDCTR